MELFCIATIFLSLSFFFSVCLILIYKEQMFTFTSCVADAISFLWNLLLTYCILIEIEAILLFSKFKFLGFYVSHFDFCLCQYFIMQKIKKSLSMTNLIALAKLNYFQGYNNRPLLKGFYQWLACVYLIKQSN